MGAALIMSGIGEPIGALSLQAQTLFGIAKRAYQRVREKPPRQFTRHDDVIVAVVFAALATEAYINEAGAEAAMREATSSKSPYPLPPSVLAKVFPPSVFEWGRRWQEAERRGARAEEKYSIASEVFIGASYPKGQEPYQQYALLMKVRDAIVHLKARDVMLILSDGRMAENPDGTWVMQHHPILKKLRSLNITAEGIGHNPWLDQITTPAAARWACYAASAMVKSFIELLPISAYRHGREMGFTFVGWWNPDADSTGKTNQSTTGR